MAGGRVIKILDVDEKEVQQRLKTLKAERIGKSKSARMEYLIKGDMIGSHSWIRVVTEGKSTKVRLEEMSDVQKDNDFKPITRFEFGADSFRDAARLMGKLAGSKLLYSENESEDYLLGGAHVRISTWPQVPAFVEIESPSAKKTQEAYKLLKIKGRPVGDASMHRVYEIYGLNMWQVMEKNEPLLKKLLGGGQ